MKVGKKKPKTKLSHSNTVVIFIIVKFWNWLTSLKPLILIPVIFFLPVVKKPFTFRRKR